jgi:hypothetical protein
MVNGYPHPEYREQAPLSRANPERSWRVSRTQLWRYVAQAKALCKGYFDVKAEHLLSRHLLQRRQLYAHATGAGLPHRPVGPGERGQAGGARPADQAEAERGRGARDSAGGGRGEGHPDADIYRAHPWMAHLSESELARGLAGGEAWEELMAVGEGRMATTGRDAGEPAAVSVETSDNRRTACGGDTGIYPGARRRQAGSSRLVSSTPWRRSRRVAGQTSPITALWPWCAGALRLAPPSSSTKPVGTGPDFSRSWLGWLRREKKSTSVTANNGGSK